MGTRIPPIVVPPPADSGFLCSNCWGVGKEFGDIDTPEFITVIASGINKGPNWVVGDGEPPNGIYVLDQAGEFLPCIFVFIDTDFVIDVRFSPSSTVGFIQVNGSTFAYSGQSDDPCGLFILSNLNDHFTGGSFAIFIEGT